MTKLCHDLNFSCRDLVPTTYTLFRDKEKSYRDIKFLAASALCRNRVLSVATKFPCRARTSISRTQGLSCAPGLVCVTYLAWSVACAWPPLSRHNMAPHCRARQPSHAWPCHVRQSFLSWPALSRHKNLLSQREFSLPWLTLSRHGIALSRHNFSLT